MGVTNTDPLKRLYSLSATASELIQRGLRTDLQVKELFNYLQAFKENHDVLIHSCVNAYEGTWREISQRPPKVDPKQVRYPCQLHPGMVIRVVNQNEGTSLKYRVESHAYAADDVWQIEVSNEETGLKEYFPLRQYSIVPMPAPNPWWITHQWFRIEDTKNASCYHDHHHY